MLEHIKKNNEIMKQADGFYRLEKDKEAIALFLEEIEKKRMKFTTLEERFQYLIDHEYYYNLFTVDGYTMDDIQAVYAAIKAVPFQFQSYMSISKFYKDYALQTFDKQFYLEDYADRIAIVALFLARGNTEKAVEYAREMIAQNYQPATPTFLNAGRKRGGELVSCFLLEVDDTLNSIGFNIETSMQLSKIGGGVALNLSKIRGRGESIRDVKGAASGVMPVVKLLEDTFSYVNQLGQRKGAGAAYLHIFHWDIEEFLDCKKINSDEKTRIQGLSIGVICPHKFFELAKHNQDVYVFAPHSVQRVYGMPLDEMNMQEIYDVLIQDTRILKRKWMNAREILGKIAMLQLESGYPYIVYHTNANNQHPLKNLGSIKMSNLCTEIFQLQETSIIHDYGLPDEIKRDICCNLGSLNIVNVMENQSIRESVYRAMDMLTAVSDLSDISNAPSIFKANQELHSVGLGVMNLHGFFAKNKIRYESEEAKEFANLFFMTVNYHSIERSMQIAMETGKCFQGFRQSDYGTGVYFDFYTEKNISPTSEQITELFKEIFIPSKEDWMKLKEQVMKNGLYHAYRMAIAPTGSISYLQNSTSSVMPITNVIETRTYENAMTYYPMPYLTKETYWYYAKTAYDMDMMKLIDLISVIQKHVDQGISCTLFVHSDISTRELAKYYIYAEHKGLKSLYYTRTNKKNIEECLSCSV